MLTNVSDQLSTSPLCCARFTMTEEGPSVTPTPGPVSPGAGALPRNWSTTESSPTIWINAMAGLGGRIARDTQVSMLAIERVETPRPIAGLTGKKLAPSRMGSRWTTHATTWISLAEVDLTAHTGNAPILDTCGRSPSSPICSRPKPTSDSYSSVGTLTPTRLTASGGMSSLPRTPGAHPMERAGSVESAYVAGNRKPWSASGQGDDK